MTKPGATQTRRMVADDIAVAFNSVNEREYWSATVGGSRTHPEVHFNSRSSMVVLIYRIASQDFTVTFSRVSAVFGDYMASIHRSFSQILPCLKAAGLPFADMLEDDAALWIEYSPRTKESVVAIVRHGDAWANVVPMVFKMSDPDEFSGIPIIDEPPEHFLARALDEPEEQA